MKVKEKNKKLIIVVNTLILVIGVSFAFFVSRLLLTGDGSNVSTNPSANIRGIEMEVNGSLSFSDTDVYPGHTNVSIIEIIAKGDKEYIPYNLYWEGTNSINTTLNYKVYRLETKEEVTSNCKKKSIMIGASRELSEECTITNIDKLGEAIYSGTINKDDTKVKLTNGEFIEASEAGTKNYYYVIIEYPNLEEEQNSDMTGSFEGVIKAEEANIKIIGIKEENDAGEYIDIEKIPSKEEDKVLNTELSTCNNNASISWNEKTNTLQINNIGETGTECSLYFNLIKDTTVPTIGDVITSVTKTEINVTVTASDNKGVTEYWYQLDSNPAVQGTGNTHQFSGLTAGSTHTIKVYVKDEAGNQSTTTTKNVTTPLENIQEIITAVNPKTTTPNFTISATTNEGVYAVEDGMYGGTSYYWRGAVTNNYVRFANFCWRIVRINGDGSIRLIYDGTTCHANGTSTAESIAVTSQAYNTSYDRSEYVGWTYTIGSQRTLSGTASNAKTQLESWYNSNITGTNNSKVVQGKFCNDRNTASGSTWRSQPSSEFYYAAKERLRTHKKPTLSCANSGDIYTLKVGAITADEVAFAGGLYGSVNQSYYLYNGQDYWTISPDYWWYSSSSARGTYISNVNLNGALLPVYVGNTSIGLRPVINLKSDITFSSGTGTQNNPYVVQ